MSDSDRPELGHRHHGHAVGLLERLGVEPAVVLDLGCGHAAVAEVLAERGFHYVGLDIDKEALAEVAERGFETHHLDLGDTDALPGRLEDLAGGRAVTAVLLLDTLEHLPDSGSFLSALHRGLVALGAPVLVISVPNVAHYDLGAKLVTGRWDITPTGLLDATHLQFFTRDRLLGEMGAQGWAEVARDDVALYHSDQHFPPDHPVLVDGSPLHDLLLSLRQRVDDTSAVNQFVRAFAVAEPHPPRAPDHVEDPSELFLTVLVRTQGTRLGSLNEALTCLAAQTVESFEVILTVHSPSTPALTRVRDLVAGFAPAFAQRVRVEHLEHGGRAHPLNVGLQKARGRYFAVLDDDDLVTANWVEAFAGGAATAPGRIVRSITADRRVKAPDDHVVAAPYLSVGGLEFAHADLFDALEHLCINRSPVCSLAIPLEAVRAFGLRFDEELPVLEDWELLLRLAGLCGIHDTLQVTSIYHRWARGASYGVVDPDVWEATRLAILERLDHRPLLLPQGSATRLAMLWKEHHELMEIRHQSWVRRLPRQMRQRSVMLLKAWPPAHRMARRVVWRLRG